MLFRSYIVNLNLQVNSPMSLISLKKIVRLLKDKKVIAYPTEAVFGLGCDPDSEVAFHELLKIKKRPVEKGTILIAANPKQLQPYINIQSLNMQQWLTVLSCWPGPVTFLLPKQSSTPTWLTGKFHSLAVRVSAHPIVIRLCDLYGKPVVSTSANLHGLLPCRTEKEVLERSCGSIARSRSDLCCRCCLMLSLSWATLCL